MIVTATEEAGILFPGLLPVNEIKWRLMTEDSMAGNGNDLLYRLTEHMRQTSILVRDMDGTYVSVSPEMLIEIAERARAANSKEEGEQMITRFLRDVREGKITPYN